LFAPKFVLSLIVISPEIARHPILALQQTS